MQKYNALSILQCYQTKISHIYLQNPCSFRIYPANRLGLSIGTMFASCKHILGAFKNLFRSLSSYRVDLDIGHGKKGPFEKNECRSVKALAFHRNTAPLDYRCLKPHYKTKGHFSYFKISF